MYNINNLLRVKSFIMKRVVIMVLLISIVLFFTTQVYSRKNSDWTYPVNMKTFKTLSPERILRDFIVKEYYDKRKNLTTSQLGTFLFKSAKESDTAQMLRIAESKKDMKFHVLIWKYWGWLKKRHIQTFNKNSHIEDPLEGCSVQNCIFTGNETALNTADAVVVHIQKGVFPVTANRNQNQRWIFLSDESPMNTFSMAAKKPNFSTMANIFNWSMTYRSESDIPVPYGRTVPLKDPIIQNLEMYPDDELLIQLVPNFSRKRSDVLAAALISNCGIKHRMNFVDKLQKYIKIDVIGKCSKTEFKKSCPGHFKEDCSVINEYLFYLALENSMCPEYLTEKIFYNAYLKGSIPVILGAPLEDCERLLPPDSFLHADSFESLEQLANRMKEISENISIILFYHKWRNYFEVLNEHGYFGIRSYHFCRVCEALNYNDKEISIYNEDRLKKMLDKSICKT